MLGPVQVICFPSSVASVGTRISELAGEIREKEITGQ